MNGSSPNSCDTKAVMIKVRLFVTGTANDNSVDCKMKKKRTLPVWLSKNGTRYCKISMREVND